jgi:hypothetical protein
MAARSAHVGHRFLRCLVLMLTFTPLVSFVALAKGGTNMHELSSRAHAATDTAHPPEHFKGCRSRRYRDPRTHECRWPVKTEHRL